MDETRQTSQAGIFACGNVLHVHDLVDNVSKEAEIAGMYAAQYINGGIKTSRETEVKSGENVRYTLPNYIRTDTANLDIYFRVVQTIKPALINVVADGKVIKSKKAMVLNPGEMESINVDIPADSVEIKVEVKEA